MRKIVLTYGLISGCLLAGLMTVSMYFHDQLTDYALTLGYTSMVAAFLVVHFGMRAYRDNVMGGVVKFGAAFKAGMLITLITCAFYVASWEIVYHNMMPDFEVKYAAKEVERVKASGASQAQIDATVNEMNAFKESYKNPVYVVGMTFLEVFPVGLIFALVGAAVLSRKKGEAIPARPVTT